MVKLDFDKLEKTFSFGLLKQDNAVYTVPAADLLIPAEMDRFLAFYTPQIRANDPAVAAAYLAGWMANIGLALHYSLSVYNEALDFSLANLTVQLVPVGDYTSVFFCLNQWLETEGPEGEGREAFLTESLEQFYGQTLKPLYAELTRATGLPLDQLWGQLPAKYHYYFDVFKSELRPAVYSRLADDYHFLRLGVAPEVFGMPVNPFKRDVRLIESLASSAKQVPMKSKCCLYYKTDSGEYCFSCPRTTERERNEQRNRYRAAMMLKQKTSG